MKLTLEILVLVGKQPPLYTSLDRKGFNGGLAI